MPYDVLIVGAGLTGAVFAHELTQAGKRVLVLERRGQIGGNAYTRLEDGIHVHQYGAHILHTNSDELWRYLSQFAVMNRYTNSPVANYKGRLFNLPFNMNTFYQMWGVTTPAQAQEKIAQQRGPETAGEPANLEEQALRLVGRDLYETLVKGYTEKQWGRACTELPASIIRRLPLRFTFDNNYFDARHQGVPENGYTDLVRRMLEGADVRLNTDYLLDRPRWDALAPQVVYTGCLDAFFGYRLGPLAYRRVRFETERLETENFQGVAVVNYTDRETPYTRIIEHKHFAFGGQPFTIISREYSAEWKRGEEPYYPVNDARNQALLEKYQQLAAAQTRVLFCGRLAEYKYLDMDKAVENALARAQRLLRET